MRFREKPEDLLKTYVWMASMTRKFCRIKFWMKMAISMKAIFLNLSVIILPMLYLNNFCSG